MSECGERERLLRLQKNSLALTLIKNYISGLSKNAEILIGKDGYMLKSSWNLLATSGSMFYLGGTTWYQSIRICYQLVSINKNMLPVGTKC